MDDAPSPAFPRGEETPPTMTGGLSQGDVDETESRKERKSSSGHMTPGTKSPTIGMAKAAPRQGRKSSSGATDVRLVTEDDQLDEPESVEQRISTLADLPESSLVTPEVKRNDSVYSMSSTIYGTNSEAAGSDEGSNDEEEDAEPVEVDERARRRELKDQVSKMGIMDVIKVAAKKQQAEQARQENQVSGNDLMKWDEDSGGTQGNGWSQMTPAQAKRAAASSSGDPKPPSNRMGKRKGTFRGRRLSMAAKKTMALARREEEEKEKARISQEVEEQEAEAQPEDDFWKQYSRDVVNDGLAMAAGRNVLAGINIKTVQQVPCRLCAAFIKFGNEIGAELSDLHDKIVNHLPNAKSAQEESAMEKRKQLKEEISTMQSRMRVLEWDVVNLQQKFQIETVTSGDLQNAIENTIQNPVDEGHELNVMTEIFSAELNLKTLITIVNDLKDMKAAHNHEISKIKESWKDFMEDKKEMQNKLDMAYEEVSKVDNRINIITQQCIDLRVENGELKHDLQDLKKKNEQLKKDNAALVTRSEDADGLRPQVLKLKRIGVNREVRLRYIIEQQEILTKALEKSEENGERLQREKEELEKQLTDSNKSLRKVQEELISTKVDAKVFKAEFEKELRLRKTQQGGKKLFIAKQGKVLSKVLDQAEDQGKAVQNTLKTDIDTAIKQLRKEAQSLRKDLRKTEALLSEREARVKAQDMEIDILKESLNEAKQERDFSDAALHRYKEDMDQAVMTAENEIDEKYQQQLSAKEGEIEKLQKRLELLKGEALVSVSTANVGAVSRAASRVTSRASAAPMPQESMMTIGTTLTAASSFQSEGFMMVLTGEGCERLQTVIDEAERLNQEVLAIFSQLEVPAEPDGEQEPGMGPAQTERSSLRNREDFAAPNRPASAPLSEKSVGNDVPDENIEPMDPVAEAAKRLSEFLAKVQSLQSEIDHAKLAQTKTIKSGKRMRKDLSMARMSGGTLTPKPQHFNYGYNARWR